MKRSLVVSIALHAATLLYLVSPKQYEEPVPTIVIVDVVNTIKPKPKSISKVKKKKHNVPLKKLIPNLIPQKQVVDKGTTYLSPLQNDKLLYSNYYDRIRNQLQASWEYEIRQILRSNKYRNILKNRKRIVTRVIIILDSTGKLVDINLRIGSNLIDIDRAAIETIKRAGYFPNPPKDMVKNGKIFIRWDFIIY